jgi:hypothetical protein
MFRFVGCNCGLADLIRAPTCRPPRGEKCPAEAAVLARWIEQGRGRAPLQQHAEDGRQVGRTFPR